MSHSLSQAWVLAVLLPIMGFFLSTIYSYVDAIAAFRLSEWPYRRGMVVLSETRPSGGPPPFQAALALTQSGRYRMLSPDTAIFCFGRRLFGLRLSTSVPIRGTIRWTAGSAEIRGRLPSSAIWGWAFWVWSVLAFAAIDLGDPKGDRSILWFFPLAILFMMAAGPALIPFEKKRAMKVAAEVLSWERVAVAPPSEGVLRRWPKRFLWFAALFIPLWLGITGSISVASGWHALGQRFRASDSQRHYSQTNASLRMRKEDGVSSSYGKMVRLGVDEQGIALGLPTAFQLLSPPLFIPWSAVRSCRTILDRPAHPEVVIVVTDPPVTIEIEDQTDRISEMHRRSR